MNGLLSPAVIVQYLLRAVVVLITIPFHESAHALANHLLGDDTAVRAAFYAVFDSPNTFLGSVQTDIVQANIVSCLLCAFAKPFRISPRKSCLLREIHAVL